MDDKVEKIKVKIFDGILNFEGDLRLLHTYSIFLTSFLVDFQIALGFLCLKHTLKAALTNLVPNKI